MAPIRSPGRCCGCANGSTGLGGPGSVDDDDAMATMYVAALHHLMQCWGQHPLLARLAAPLAERDRFIRTVAGLAMAKLLYDGGNRVGFSLSGGDVDLHFTTPVDEPCHSHCSRRMHCNGGRRIAAAPTCCAVR